MRFLVFVGKVFLTILAAKFFFFLFPFLGQFIHPTLHETIVFYTTLGIGFVGGLWARKQ